MGGCNPRPRLYTFTMGETVWERKVDRVIGRLSQYTGRNFEATYYRDELVKAYGKRDETRCKAIMMACRDIGLCIDDGRE